MKVFFLWVITIVIVVSGCNTSDSEKEKWKTEILQTEKAFSEFAQKEGVGNAFAKFADNDAVIMRNNNLVIGKEGLLSYYSETMENTDTKLSWRPEFVDVSNSGDLGYTYGYYTFTVKDTLDNKIVTKGVFHTVWKRQDDGSWKFVWD